MSTGEIDQVGSDDELREALKRLVRQLVHEDPPSGRRGEDLMPILDAHLGVRADDLPVVVEPVTVHRWADTDIAIGRSLAVTRRRGCSVSAVAISATTARWAT